MPLRLKRALTQRATRERRSLSAQVVCELERAMADEPDGAKAGKSAVGMFSGAVLPTDDDFLEIRSALWGRLSKSHG